MNVRFLSEAKNEMDDAFLWYEEQVTGLGYDFLGAVDDGIYLISSFPNSYEVVRDELRRCILKRFPFCVIYGVENDVIVVVAVAHMKKFPA